MSLDPVVLFFILGLTAGLARAEMRLPPAIYEFLSVIPNSLNVLTNTFHCLTASGGLSLRNSLRPSS